MTEIKCDYAQCCNTLDSVYKIYCLRHPESNNIFYIGMTIKELNERLNAHIMITTQSNKRRVDYIRNLVSNGQVPVIELLESVKGSSMADKIYASQREQFWIKICSDLGMRILNVKGNRGYPRGCSE